MVVILYQDGCQDITQKIAEHLMTAFADHIVVECISADSAAAWPSDVSWDDLLIVIYDKKDFPLSGNTFISQYMQSRGGTALLLPVAVDVTFPKPPEAAAAIKALPYDSEKPGRLVNRVGGMLGLRLQGRDSKIFISYRASDGTAVAKQLYDHLVALGHRPFLDEAKELDGETAILPGSAVQKQIDD
ncbi:MAG TPA: hypothetical protein VFS39_04665, partial [Nitrospira sp.]|nr:hypothetical protein [Nitrospira sp.]